MEVVEFRIARVIARAIGADRPAFAAGLSVDDPYYEPRLDVDVVHIRCARDVAEALRTKLRTRPPRAAADFGEACLAITLEIVDAALRASVSDRAPAADRANAPRRSTGEEAGERSFG
jgi:hypothetical protein